MRGNENLAFISQTVSITLLYAKEGESMVRFRLLDKYGNIVDGIDVLFATRDIHTVRRYVDFLFGELRQYGMRLHLNILD